MKNDGLSKDRYDALQHELIASEEDLEKVAEEAVK